VFRNIRDSLNNHLDCDFHDGLDTGESQTILLPLFIE